MRTQMICLIALSLMIAGCGSSPETEKQAAPSTESHADHDHEHGDSAKSDMEMMQAELAKLPAEDATSAKAQHFCPVSSKMLGTMGAPKKVDVEGQTVWICCEGCRDAVVNDSEKYLAKLKKE